MGAKNEKSISDAACLLDRWEYGIRIFWQIFWHIFLTKFLTNFLTYFLTNFFLTNFLMNLLNIPVWDFKNYSEGLISLLFCHNNPCPKYFLRFLFETFFKTFLFLYFNPCRSESYKTRLKTFSHHNTFRQRVEARGTVFSKHIVLD